MSVRSVSDREHVFVKGSPELMKRIRKPVNKRNACADDEGDDLKDLVDGDFKPSLAQKSGSHGHSGARHHENPDVKNLGSLSKEVLGKDVKSPEEKEKEEQKRIFAKAARTEARLKKSLHDEVRDVAHRNAPVVEVNPRLRAILHRGLAPLSACLSRPDSSSQLQLAAIRRWEC